MARSLLTAHARFALVALVGCATACSILLKEKPIPCSTDLDCAKVTGSHCDIAQAQCVSGAPELSEAGGPDAIADTTPHDALVDTNPGDDGSDGEAGLGDDGSIDAPIDQDASVGPPTAPDWDKVKTFLQNLYDDQQHLVRRAPGDTTYHLTNDNALAMRAFALFPTPDTDKANAISARLKGMFVCFCGDNFGHTADINHLVDHLTQPKGSYARTHMPPVPQNFCSGQPAQLPSNSACPAGADAGAGPVCAGPNFITEDHAKNGWGGDSWCHSDICTGSPATGYDDTGKGHGAADLIALQIINLKNQGGDPGVLWANLKGKYDGIGVYDAYTDGQHAYSTYKLALYKLAARAVGEALPASVDLTLAASQSKATGGIRGQYGFNGDFSTASDQVGDAETTSYTVLSYLMPDADLF